MKNNCVNTCLVVNNIVYLLHNQLGKTLNTKEMKVTKKLTTENESKGFYLLKYQDSEHRNIYYKTFDLKDIQKYLDKLKIANYVEVYKVEKELTVQKRFTISE